MLRVASRWFERKTMDDGLTLLWEPHVHPLLRCNIWHLRGRDRDLLVDTGLGVAPLRSEIADLIEKPLAAVATHIHYDHVGGLHEFEERWMHRIEAPRMNPYDEFNPLVTSLFPDFILEQLADAGYPIEQDMLIDALPHRGTTPPTSRRSLRRRRAPSTRGTLSTSATGASRCCTYPATPREVSGCGRQRAGSSSLETPSTTDHCSTTFQTATSRTTSGP